MHEDQLREDQICGPLPSSTRSSAATRRTRYARLSPNPALERQSRMVTGDLVRAFEPARLATRRGSSRGAGGGAGVAGDGAEKDG